MLFCVHLRALVLDLVCVFVCVHDFVFRLLFCFVSFGGRAETNGKLELTALPLFHLFCAPLRRFALP